MSHRCSIEYRLASDETTNSFGGFGPFFGEAMGERERLLQEHLWSFLTDDRRQRLLGVLAQRTRHLTVVLENVYQPHNTSAVLRSCDAFGVQDVHITEAENHFRVTREIALGTDKWLTIHRYTQASDPSKTCIEKLRRDGYRILVTSPSDSAMPLADVDISERTALVIGHEKNGVSQMFQEAADACVVIPTCGFVDSLNLSVAAAVCLRDLTRRMRKSDATWQLSDAERDVLLRDWTARSVPNVEAIKKRFRRECEMA
ncbi:MAG: RNA methyltransferase [Planctomycetaceae bacterium]|nr:RNA methyltransferase [Planctomycetaceae bacterium]